MTAGCPSREEHAGLHRLGLLSLGLHHWRFYELLLRWPGRPDKHNAVGKRSEPKKKHGDIAEERDASSSPDPTGAGSGNNIHPSLIMVAHG